MPTIKSAPVFDAAAAARLDRTYSTPAIREQRRRFREAIAARPGEVGLDVGCGPGLLACELAREVAPDGRIHGIDTSNDMLRWARQRALRENVREHVDLQEGSAVQLRFDDDYFDFLTASQVYCFVSDISVAIHEAGRVLRKGGRLVILDTDWDIVTWNSSDRHMTRRMLEARATDYAHPYLPRQLPQLLISAGFELTNVEAYTIIETDCNEDSFGEGVIESAQKAALRSGIAAGEVNAWVHDLHDRAAKGEYFFCANRFIFSSTKR